MDSKIIKTFKASLLAELKEIERKQASDDSALEINPDDLRDQLDVASANSQHAVIRELQNRDNVSLIKIKAALQRIANGTYGFCARCDEEIALRRLEARPTAAFCVRCQSIAEYISSAA